MLSSSLPICAAFRSKSNGNKYLRYCADDGSANRQLLRLIGDDAESPLSRFYVEPSSKHDGLVHVRCSYNNKYWAAQKLGAPDEWSIAGSADMPEEDLSQQSCTLFQLKHVRGNLKTVRFFHAHLRKYSGIFSSDSKWANEGNQDLLCMGDEEQSEEFVLELFQWMLPKYVCFKGDNGKYLSARSLDNKLFLVFDSEDINDPTVRHTTTANRDGTMRIKSDHFDRFWRNSGSTTGSGSWVHADSADDTSNDNDDPNTLFQAFCTGGAIGILNQGSNQYCKRLTTKNVEHGLSASGTRFEAWSRLQFEEPVVFREIDHVHFKDEQAVIVGNDRYTALATASVTNSTASTMPAVKLTLDYTLEETWGWHSTVTLKSPVRTSITSPFVYLQYGFLAMSPRFFHGLISWGADHKKGSKVTQEYVVDVPPMTKVTVTCQGVEASFDVPFSYRQTDKLIDGEVVTLQYDDGNFSGRNVHTIHFVTREEKIGQ